MPKTETGREITIKIWKVWVLVLGLSLIGFWKGHALGRQHARWDAQEEKSLQMITDLKFKKIECPPGEASWATVNARTLKVVTGCTQSQVWEINTRPGIFASEKI